MISTMKGSVKACLLHWQQHNNNVNNDEHTCSWMLSLLLQMVMHLQLEDEAEYPKHMVELSWFLQDVEHKVFKQPIWMRLSLNEGDRNWLPFFFLLLLWCVPLVGKHSYAAHPLQPQIHHKQSYYEIWLVEACQLEEWNTLLAASESIEVSCLNSSRFGWNAWKSIWNRRIPNFPTAPYKWNTFWRCSLMFLTSLP